jgi:hypothetical protein
MTTPAAFVMIDGVTHLVTTVTAYGEDEHDGLVRVYAHRPLFPAQLHTVLAEDIFIHPSQFQAAVAAAEWGEGKVQA